MATAWKPPYRPLGLSEPAELAPTGGLLVIQFWAPWNGTDRMYNPELTPVRDHYAGWAVFRSADVDEPALEPLTRACQAVNVPALVGLIGGRCVDTVIGLRPRAELARRIGSWIRQARSVIDPRWRTADVVGLARGMVEAGTLDRLALLSDALLDAGCDDEAVLRPCRTGDPAGDTWWLVDLLLGRR